MSTLLSTKEIEDLTQILNYRYASFRKERTFRVDVKSEGTVVELVVTLQDPQQLFFYPLNARLDTAKQNMSLRDAALFLLDYIDCYWDEYFNSQESVFVPIDWHDYSFEDVAFQLRGQIQNLHYEKLGDELLNKTTQVSSAQVT